MASCPHTIGVEFGTRIIEVDKQKIKLQIWDVSGLVCLNPRKLLSLFCIFRLQAKNDSEQ